VPKPWHRGGEIAVTQMGVFEPRVARCGRSVIAALVPPNAFGTHTLRGKSVILRIAAELKAGSIVPAHMFATRVMAHMTGFTPGGCAIKPAHIRFVARGRYARAMHGMHSIPVEGRKSK